MDVTEVEGLAVALYRRLGFDPAKPASPFRIARALLGPDAIERGTGIVGEYAKLFEVNGQQRIAVNRRIAEPYQRFYVGHELGHVVLKEQNYREPDVEQVCDQFGAALLAPIPAVIAFQRACGPDHEAFAAAVGSTQTWAALRFAEALRVPRAVITPVRVYARGPEEFVWGPTDSLRRLARGRARPGIVRTKLTDDARRVVVDVEDVG